MTEDLEILEGPEVYADKGFAVRLTYNSDQDNYRVEYAPLLQDGDVSEEWAVFGGTVGYSNSVYDSEEEAREFFDQLGDMPSEEIMDHFAVGENQ